MSALSPLTISRLLVRAELDVHLTLRTSPLDRQSGDRNMWPLQIPASQSVIVPKIAFYFVFPLLSRKPNKYITPASTNPCNQNPDLIDCRYLMILPLYVRFILKSSRDPVAGSLPASRLSHKNLKFNSKKLIQGIQITTKIGRSHLIWRV